MKIRVLFVCLGNICRSPMAEAVFRQFVDQAGFSDRIEVDSAGTGDWHIGKPPHEGTRSELDLRQIPYEGMKARQVVMQDLDLFQYIICMDANNLRDVRDMLELSDDKRSGLIENGPQEQLFTFMQLLPERGIINVPDPYYDGNFEFVYDLVEDGCSALLEKIKMDHGLTV